MDDIYYYYRRAFNDSFMQLRKAVPMVFADHDKLIF